MRNWKDVEAKFLKDPETKAEFEALRPQYEVISQIIKARSEQGLTQEELAARTGLQRSNISRLESGSYNPSIELLARVAKGLGMELHVEFRAPQSTR
ncbi:helix-turn-helix transcriptional regulator [Clostridium sp. D33t1_170424_F3]|uniref:helix-turn-helix transcriptional regulator n=1 Tax=Clostridium sp. D33t1_170424_F3 TaxID=2787099 RepID=UPI0018A8B9E7|nr:helix-turn-helix transcriptional regulator [Clostridium sp. D33t1_170424_F3]